jgi:protein-S-isoprenylcysteine O-methyltransferase Ste14
MRIAIRILFMESLIAAVLFGSAGRLDLPWYWALIALHALMVSMIMYLIPPDLRSERMNPGPGEQDRHLRLLLMPLLLIHLVVAGLDARFSWSPDPGPVVRSLGLLGMVASLALASWAMYTNRFFSCAVRLQDDRGHRVVSSGPYRFVRHPGYTGMVCCALAGACALGSWYSFLPLLPTLFVVALRASREERFLSTALEGYAEYAHRVRYRLVPGLW